MINKTTSQLPHPCCRNVEHEGQETITCSVRQKSLCEGWKGKNKNSKRETRISDFYFFISIYLLFIRFIKNEFFSEENLTVTSQETVETALKIKKHV